ncbi:hypothetical protein Tco_0666683 [Tanacetum coccineum]
MFGTIPPIPPPFGASSGNPGSPNVNRVDTMPATTDPINTTNTTNVSQSVVDENLPQLLDSRGGDIMSINRYKDLPFMADLNAKYHERALLANQKRFYKRSGRLGGKGRRKDKISSKEVVFTKADESSSTLAPEITSDSKSEFSPTYVIKKKTEKSLVGPKPCSNKKADSSTEQLLLTLIEEVKGLKRKIKIPSGTPPSSTQPSSSKASKQKTWFGPCKHCGFRNHLSDDCYSKPKCSTCGSTDHLTKEHLEHAVVKKTLSKLKAPSPLKPSPKKTPMIPKPFIECKYRDLIDNTLTT